MCFSCDDDERFRDVSRDKISHTYRRLLKRRSFALDYPPGMFHQSLFYSPLDADVFPWLANDRRCERQPSACGEVSDSLKKQGSPCRVLRSEIGEIGGLVSASLR